MTQTIELTDTGNIQVEVKDETKEVHFISCIDNKLAIEVITSVKTLETYTLLMN